MAEAADEKRFENDWAHQVGQRLTSLKSTVDTTTSPDQLNQVVADLTALLAEADGLTDTQAEIRQEIEIAEHRREQLKAEQAVAPSVDLQ